MPSFPTSAICLSSLLAPANLPPTSSTLSLPPFFPSSTPSVHPSRPFPQTRNTLSSFITSTLSSLQSTFAERLSAFSNHHGPTVLPELITIFHATKKFAVATDKILERAEASSASLSPPNDSSSSESMSRPPRRQTSHGRLSISRRMSLSVAGPGSLLAGSGLDWDTEVYEPSLEYQVSYGILEAKFLTSSLPEPTPQVDPARELRERTRYS